MPYWERNGLARSNLEARNLEAHNLTRLLEQGRLDGVAIVGTLGRRQLIGLRRRVGTIKHTNSGECY